MTAINDNELYLSSNWYSSICWKSYLICIFSLWIQSALDRLQSVREDIATKQESSECAINISVVQVSLVMAWLQYLQFHFSVMRCLNEWPIHSHGRSYHDAQWAVGQSPWLAQPFWLSHVFFYSLFYIPSERWEHFLFYMLLHQTFMNSIFAYNKSHL